MNRLTKVLIAIGVIFVLSLMWMKQHWVLPSSKEIVEVPYEEVFTPSSNRAKNQFEENTFELK